MAYRVMHYRPNGSDKLIGSYESKEEANKVADKCLEMERYENGDVGVEDAFDYGAEPELEERWKGGES